MPPARFRASLLFLTSLLVTAPGMLRTRAQHVESPLSLKLLRKAVTGGDDTVPKFASVPFKPNQIADEAIDACAAGAAIAHIHVRDPENGKPSMGLDLYREVVERIRESGSPVIINLTTGPGARFIPSSSEANTAAPGSNLRTPEERVRHILALKPEICSLDMGSLNFGKGALINVPSHIEAIAAEIRRARKRHHGYKSLRSQPA